MPRVTDPTMVKLLLTAWKRVHSWNPQSPSKPGDVYFFGVRNASDVCGPWDDVLGALVASHGWWELHLWRGTTDPGREGTGAGLNDRGVCRLVPGRYVACWTIGTHKGRSALVQRGPGVFRCWRDVDVDGRLVEGGKVYTDALGVNAHGPGREVQGAVQGYSLGCQVTRTDADHAERMALARAQVAAGLGSTFSYVLTDAADAPELWPLFGRVGIV